MCIWAWLHPEGYFVKNHRENSTSGARSWKMKIFLVWILFLMTATSTGQANLYQGFWAVVMAKDQLILSSSSGSYRV